ncbi:MAG: heavy metal translocating P-type ATPase [Eubacteriales bacterium]|nr:heavy metal translocating P-type ATPase [Eubacteriales bacterium]
MEKKVYILENLGCANCASKIERKVAALPGVSEATITFATKQLRLTAEDPDALIPEIQKIANALEPEIVITERKRKGSGAAAHGVEQAHAEHDEHGHGHDEHEHHHEHGDSCGCGHDHGHDDHEHHHEHGDACGCGHDHGHDEHEHHHEHGDACGCGHDHDHEGHEHHHDDHEHHHEHGDSCGCGHDHGHDEHEEHAHEPHHERGDACGCGHDHEHGDHPHSHHVPGHPDDCDCELCHPHEEYCDVCGQSLANCTCRMPDEDCIKRVYILENLGCANCAAKMEKKIKELPDVKYATITYTTKQLRLSAKDPDALLPQIQAICSSIESEVRVVPRSKNLGATVTRIYTVENLGCANCAAKMERRISDLPGVTNATLTFATKQLKVSGKDPDSLLEDMQRICSSIESEVKLVPRDKRPKSEEVLKVSDVVPPAREVKPMFQLTDNQKTLAEIGVGAVLFIAGEVLEHMHMEMGSLIVLIIAYVLLGGRIVLTAVKNLTKGQIFDENFLMSVATLGAFAIREYPEAVGVMLFYRIGEFFEHIAVEKSRGQIMDAVDMRPEVVNLVIGDEVKVIDAEEANVGDILLIRPGDRIPLDGVIIEGESRIDTSPVTGEPVPVKAGYGDEVTSGCVNTSGLLKIRVEKILEESMVTRILDSVENAAASKPKIDRFITRFARIYTPFVVILAACTAIIPSLFTGDWNYWVYTALSFLVMSCPCALVLSVPLAFFSGIGAGSKRGILFKGGVSLEAMKNVDAVVMDKTGTITKGNFVLQRAIPTGDVSADELLSLCASCELTSTHPIGNSIVTAAKDRNLSVVRPSSVEEIAGHGIRAILPEGEILCGNRKLMDKFHVSLDGYEKEGFGTEVLAAKDGVFIGHLVISDTIKEDAQSAIAQIKKLGIATVMLTGDAQDSAEAVAAATGIDEVHAKLLPQDKLNELTKVRNAHGAVMFVGDGINDAPVLAGADVGAAMGSGADAAIEAADVVFMTSSMEAIPQSLAIARATSRISWQNVVFALVVKVLVMILGLCGYASMWMAVFADTGVAMLCVLNSIRVLYKKDK